MPKKNYRLNKLIKFFAFVFLSFSTIFSMLPSLSSAGVCCCWEANCNDCSLVTGTSCTGYYTRCTDCTTCGGSWTNVMCGGSFSYSPYTTCQSYQMYQYCSNTMDERCVGVNPTCTAWADKTCPANCPCSSGQRYQERTCTNNDYGCAATQQCLDAHYDTCKKYRFCDLSCGSGYVEGCCGYGPWVDKRVCASTYTSGNNCYHGGSCCSCLDCRTSTSGASCINGGTVCEPCDGYGYCSYDLDSTQETSCPGYCDAINKKYVAALTGSSPANKCTTDGWKCDYANEVSVECCIDNNCIADKKYCKPPISTIDYGNRYAKCDLTSTSVNYHKCTICGGCSVATDCDNQCCEATIGVGDKCVPITTLRSNNQYLCASSSPAGWQECNEQYVSKMLNVDGSSYICMSENGKYTWTQVPSASLFAIFVAVAFVLYSSRKTIIKSLK